MVGQAEGSKKHGRGLSKGIRDAITTCGVIALLGSTSQPAFSKQDFHDIKLTPDVTAADENSTVLRPDAKEVAQLLRIEPYIERVRQAELSGAKLDRPLLNAKVFCMWRILETAQEVRKFTAAIDKDLAASYVALDSLQSLRDNAQNAVNTFNFMQGGVLGIMKQSLFLNHRRQASQYPLVVSASVGTGLSAINLLTQNIWFRKIDHEPNTLRHFFSDRYAPPDANRSYLWKFFNQQVPGSTHNLTRREVLMKHWESVAALNAKNEARLHKLSAAPIDQHAHFENIRLLTQRISLLYDLKTHVEELDASLYELQKSITSKN